MDFFDISRDIRSAEVYPGDPAPAVERIRSEETDERFTVSKISLCAHTGTHIDAPLHADEDGGDVTTLKMSRFFGQCTVVSIAGLLTGADMERLLPRCSRRLIFHTDGKAFLTISAARVIADMKKLLLIGTDAPSIADPSDEYNIHRELALAGIAVLEGARLDGVDDGVYTLSAFPLKFSGLEAAPCRAILMRERKGY